MLCTGVASIQEKRASKAPGVMNDLYEYVVAEFGLLFNWDNLIIRPAKINTMKSMDWQK